MFRSKRNSLVKRLWKYRINDETRGSSQKEISPSSSSKSLPSSQEDVELKSVTHSFFKRLKEDQLKILVQAMESKGGEVTPCVPVPKSDLCLGRHTVSPHVLCCRVFRWPDLRSDVEMKRLPSCTRQNEEKESVVCCNPYHWSLVVKIDEPPIQTRKSSLSVEPLQRTGKDSHSEDKSPRITQSTESDRVSSTHPAVFTGHTSDNAEYDCLLWCTIAYWELRERVGRLFSVTEPSVHIFQHLPHGDGMCLRLFQQPTNIDMVKRTREKIGFGIILSREAAHRNNANSARASEEASSASTMPVGVVVPSVSSPPSSGIVVSSPPSSGNVVPSVSSPSSGNVVPSVSSPPSSGNVVPSLKPVTSPSCARMESCRSHRAGLSSFPATSYCKPVTSFSGTPKPCDSYDLVASAGGGGGAALGCEETEVQFQFCDADRCSNQAEGQPQQQKQHSFEAPSRHVSGLCNESSDLKPTVMLPQTSTSSSSSSSSLSLQSLSSLPLYTSSSSVRDLHYSNVSVQYGSWVVNATTHLVNKFVNGNNKNSSINNRATGGFSEENSIKSSRATESTGVKGNITSAQTTSGTSFTSVSSDLPCRKGEVWAYNASNFPIFVNSPTLDDPKSPRSLVVKKVPPGYSIKIFDYARAELLERTEARSMLLNDGPFDPCSVRISLAKGWGPSYSRQFITSCPCWLEVLLGVKRHSSVS